MTTGQCACGVLKYSFSSEPVISVLCHCSGCKRASSSDYTNNLIIPVDAFQMTSGTAKIYTSKGGSGKGCSKYFCEECGTMLYIDSEITPGLVILKAGTLDDLSLNETKYKPAAEIFCENKYSWLPNVEGAEQFNGAMGT
ncbi:glutathione-dependent formaldehyde-activating protein [Fusarium avenaceum]|nr:glutathione-dependent formaldehyde-activating protein [Fusarium avenaceum]